MDFDYDDEAPVVKAPSAYKRTKEENSEGYRDR